VSKIQPRKRQVNLPSDPTPESEQEQRQPVDVETIYRGVAASILRDPVSSPMDKLRALDAYMRVRPAQPPTVEQLTREEVAQLSTEQLDELLGYLTRPLNARDPREVEREIATKTAKLEAEFEGRVEARVRELVDVDAVAASVEQRARQIAEQGRPLAPAPTPVEAEEPERRDVGGWPPARQPRRLR
jgi:hypothetical protein